MPRRLILHAILASAALPAMAATATAAADGLPAPVAGDGIRPGVAAAAGDARYAAVPASDRTTLLRISMTDGAIEATNEIDGRYGVPAVAVDGTPSGLSHDGETLVLINPRRAFPREETGFVVVDPRRLRVTDEISLQGDFSFDALSPDGRTLYLIEYTSRRDPGAYLVRAFDLETGELDPDPILDPSEAPDEMRGFPMTRATSPDGRWEYTLYDGGGGEPFIHALDVVDAQTVCIDLPMLSSSRSYRTALEVAADGATVTATNRGVPVAVVDTESFDVHEPAEPVGDPAPEESGDRSVGGVAVGAIAVGAVLVAGTVFGLRRRRGL